MDNRTGRVRAYLGCSLDGFIAGPNNTLDWLAADYSAPAALPRSPDYLEFEAFMASVGCLLMGRTTYDIVAAMEAWPYGQVPVLVATHRPLTGQPATVSAAAGTLPELLARAHALADGGDIYLDGSTIVRQALQADLLDALVLTQVPVLLGAGTRLFDTLPAPRRLQFSAAAASGGGLLQLHAQVLHD
ncbi:MAG: hypothetical protein GAK31_00661 [Stenotrophomonas maltophilia]|uniref:Bacterial bifunctional deaminase-reductase C-terminal domain-containing protein n=1 Tax=Stenotrophomonas maltophilia TaxID=40324 RepID=A0A7V8JNH8_STEMA|nr:MAG: hypothetical protein GAK31_00661 [Stenotrophomonas maltophilia]